MELTEVINDIDDITDPSSMEKVLIYLDFIEAKDEEFIELLISKLPQMEITWVQPWYQQSKSLTRPVPYNSKIEDNFRTDKITKEESDRIQKNWRKFRKQFNVPDNPECFARWKNTTKSRSPKTPEECVRRFVIAYLARKLKRTLCQVKIHVANHYGNPHKGQYSLEEEKVMEVCFYHQTKNAVPILSKILGREARGIYKKLNEWLNGAIERKRIKWTLPVASKFLNSLIKYTGLSLDELKYTSFEKSIWLKLEKDMDQHYIYLQKFWVTKLHVQLFVKKDIKINKLRTKIGRMLRSSSYKVWTDIKWKEIAKELPDGITSYFIYKVWHTLVNKCKDYLKMPLDELLNQAVQRISSCPSRRLRTLMFDNNGQLREIRYEKEKNKHL